MRCIERSSLLADILAPMEANKEAKACKAGKQARRQARRPAGDEQAESASDNQIKGFGCVNMDSFLVWLFPFPAGDVSCTLAMRIM